jgi:hypothetical protein
VERSASMTRLDLPEDEAVEAPAPPSAGRADRGLGQLAARVRGAARVFEAVHEPAS